MNMKKKEFKISALAVFTLTFLFVAASAQAPVIVKADVPFSFMVQNTMLPAGMYNIEEIDTNELSIYNEKLEVRVSVMTDPLKSDGAAPYSELVFNEYQGKDFLSKIWVQGKEDGYYVPLSRYERDMMKMGPPKIKKVKCD
jgi:hypothetical protein